MTIDREEWIQLRILFFPWGKASTSPVIDEGEYKREFQNRIAMAKDAFENLSNILRHKKTMAKMPFINRIKY